MIQIIKQGHECWVLTRVESTMPNTHEYETIGRVRRDGAMYYVDLPDWKEETYTWVRQPRGYLVPKPAYKFIIDNASKEKMVQ